MGCYCAALSLSAQRSIGKICQKAEGVREAEVGKGQSSPSSGEVVKCVSWVGQSGAPWGRESEGRGRDPSNLMDSKHRFIQSWFCPGGCVSHGLTYILFRTTCCQLHLIDRKAEVLGAWVSCPVSHSSLQASPGCRHKLVWFQRSEFSTMPGGQITNTFCSLILPKVGNFVGIVHVITINDVQPSPGSWNVEFHFVMLDWCLSTWKCWETFLIATAEVRGAPSMRWVEVREAARHPSMHGLMVSCGRELAEPECPRHRVSETLQPRKGRVICLILPCSVHFTASDPVGHLLIRCICTKHQLSDRVRVCEHTILKHQMILLNICQKYSWDLRATHQSGV